MKRKGGHKYTVWAKRRVTLVLRRMAHTVATVLYGLNGIMKRKGGHKADDPENTTNINESMSCLFGLLKTHRI